ncbi:hypothetical protein E4U41_003709 [Claviceps citrina]|nr:hypothetical protein E4U41_003709 [Claviceps citrina]
MVMNDADLSQATSAESPRCADIISRGRSRAACSVVVSRSSSANAKTDGGGSSSSSTVAGAAVVSSRGLTDGAKAGTAVGAFVAAALVAFCLYPVIVHLIKRRKRAGRALDAEPGLPTHHRGKGSTLGPNSHIRLSSTDSLQQHGERSRGGLGGRTLSKELEWTLPDAGLTQTEGNVASSRQLSAATAGDGGQLGGADRHGGAFEDGEDDYRNETTPFPFYMPASMPDDDPGVLKGTSYDYYRPSIPSSAFGMVTAPDSFEPVRASSRGSSLKHNLKQMLRWPSGGDSSPASDSSTQDKGTRLLRASSSSGPGLGGIHASGRPTDSPTEPSATTTLLRPPSERVSASSPAAINAPEAPSQPVVTTPPHSHSPTPDERAAFKASPSPPSDPAPGTVNPMDIMPASTQSEMRHRTEHQLLANSYGSGGGPSCAGEQADREDMPKLTPPPVLSVASAAARIFPPTDQEAVQEAPRQEHYDGAMLDLQSHNHLSPSVMPERGRHPSFSSNHSTPCPGAHSTGPSTENTPSTQVDSPSPGSMNSSDFRHSASPQPGLSSLKASVFRCDEPGCSQAFDQPHKLNKDHKCPYKDCGKGFGTKTHLQRHINDRHEKRKKFHCAIPGCDYSKSGVKAFPRKDNWKRHMIKIHNMDQQQLPEPIEMDSEMGGTT